MKLLFDENLSYRLCQLLDDAFPRSTQVQLAGLTSADDGTIWDFAGAGGFILVSLDADFAERAALRGPPPKVLWLRCGNRPTEYVEKLLRDHMEAIAEFERGAAACLEIY